MSITDDFTKRLLAPDVALDLSKGPPVQDHQRGNPIIPTVLLVDRSWSMGDGSPPDIVQANQSLRDYLKRMQTTDDPALMAMKGNILTSIYSYGTSPSGEPDIKEEIPWTNGKDVDPSQLPTLEAIGLTPLATALIKVAEECYGLIKHYRSSKPPQSFGKFIIVNITDGAPTDMWFEPDTSIMDHFENPDMYKNWLISQAHWRYLCQTPGHKRGFAELVHIITPRGHQRQNDNDLTGADILVKHADNFATVFTVEPGEDFTHLIQFVYKSVTTASMAKETLSEVIANDPSSKLKLVSGKLEPEAPPNSDPFAVIAEAQNIKVKPAPASDIASPSPPPSAAPPAPPPASYQPPPQATTPPPLNPVPASAPNKKTRILSPEPPVTYNPTQPAPPPKKEKKPDDLP